MAAPHFSLCSPCLTIRTSTCTDLSLAALETAPIKGTNGENDAHTNQHNENSLFYLTEPFGSTGTAALFLERSLMWPPVSPSFPLPQWTSFFPVQFHLPEEV